MNSNKCKHGFDVDPNGYHIYTVKEHETGNTYTVKEEPLAATASNKRDTWKEAERLANKELATETATKQQPSINEIKRLSKLLEDAYNY